MEAVYDTATGERRMPGLMRSLGIVRGELEGYSMQEVTDAWQVVHTCGARNRLLPWQIGTLQNLIFGQVISGLKVLPELPASFVPYGALKGIEK